MFPACTASLSAPSTDGTAETGTIAGIASAIGMALMGVVTSYISYQKKKLCFSIQAQQTLLQSPMTDPTSQDVARV
ncbi:UNVERIFIED_CONTAM: hypothetical protein FKN15_049415 [Acipenser sinensis]